MRTGWPFTGLEFRVDRDEMGIGWGYSVFAGPVGCEQPEMIEAQGGFFTKGEAIRAALESEAGL